MVQGLIADGFAVDVLCGLPNYPKGEWFAGYRYTGPRRETWQGARVFRAGEVRRKGNTSLRIFLNYVSWPFFALFHLWRLPGGYDAVLCYNTSPVLMSFPALVYGGSASIEHIRKGDAITHQHLLFEMDSKPDDTWSEAYEANPHVFELEDGGLLVSFTLTETVDTILPIAPETQYAIEGETISRWVIVFFSLSKDDNLGILEYHEALELLQPYIQETRGSNILVRGLSLEEMECILSKG